MKNHQHEKKIDFADLNVRIAIAYGVALIAFLLLFIGFRLL